MTVPGLATEPWHQERIAPKMQRRAGCPPTGRSAADFPQLPRWVMVTTRKDRCEPGFLAPHRADASVDIGRWPG